MSLYYDAVSVLTAPASTGGSFKSRIYNSRSLKASPAQLYALIIEASKWDILLKEVIEAAGIIKLEPKLTPHLALLLVHDHLLAKNGIAAPAAHPLRQAVERHKTRLRGEFTKARVRRGCATVADLRDAIRREKDAANGDTAIYPRWVRINNVRTDLAAQLQSTFASYRQVESLPELARPDEPRLRIDPHIPDLVAVPPGLDFSTSPAYRSGEIILQDKASCFPAYLLLGDQEEPWRGDLMDGCAAPGNKTTHMASLLSKTAKASKQGRTIPRSHIFSMDASAVRAKTLQKMVSAAGADSFVSVLQGQDFLALDPHDPRFENVSGLLLDPSCSGSGIIGRDDKRKRRQDEPEPSQQTKHQKGQRNPEPDTPSATDENDLPSAPLSADRLTKLSNLQTRIVEHALAFPAATRITYSTCSIHLLENEAVVSRVLASDVARTKGWRVMRRDEQPEGLRRWKYRGVREERVQRTSTSIGGGEGENGGCEVPAVEAEEGNVDVNLTDEDLEGCLRCWPGDDEGLGGFFVAGFVRDENAVKQVDVDEEKDEEEGGEEEEDDEWEGFSD
ncbi:S-adenosyl-L-methionine-dependent methyltransferase [Aspergillus steynii IBT 23096]|uniref:S-adenosyl-L-methionine-dependent methyltransferase n=1 Tax=Aspergillus steynii IBT 23096 TaxID=1392250 RepID=A0A2I2FV96_9EURO|nr:S-adenosyl-L-methionine-dependent methyltransferase [Aspergillus steynii IBT 23096]PLB44531.1 S-adenosyl-L-methionine-dependent methyltransferase [Aspergillus steynii IBT 23096]